MEEVKSLGSKWGKTKNTEKYHISHTGGEDIEKGKDLCIFDRNRDEKNTQLKLSKSL